MVHGGCWISWQGLEIGKCQHSVNENPKDGYDWSGSSRPRSVHVNENIENVEDFVLHQEDNPKNTSIDS